MKSHPRQSTRKGFLLLEVILALMVFAIAATGFTVALQKMAEVAFLAQSELRITRFMESSLNEALSLPILEEGEYETKIIQSGNVVSLFTETRLMDDLENGQGQLLTEMYLIRVTATWIKGNQRQERMVETWRYGRMYQP